MSNDLTPIPGWQNYSITKNGDVYSTHFFSRWGRFKRKTPSFCSPREYNGYLYVMLRERKRAQNAILSRLMLLTFVGQCPAGMECAHEDGNPLNNCLSNLSWKTRKANNAQKHEHGTAQQGEHANCVKLTEAQVRFIRQEHEKGVSNEELARHCGVKNACISKVVCRRSWTHI